MRKTVVLLGKGSLAIRIADWFLNQPAWTDSLCTRADAHRVPLVPSGHYRAIPHVESETWHADLASSVFYDKIIKERVPAGTESTRSA